MAILNTLFKFHQIIHQQQFTFELKEKTKKQQREVANYFSLGNYPMLNEDELFYYCLILCLSLEDNGVSNHMVALELSMSKSDLIQIHFAKHINSLIEKEYIEKKDKHYNSRNNYQEFAIPSEIYDCVILDKPLTKLGEVKYDIVNFAIKAKTLLKSVENGNITISTAVKQLKTIQQKITSPIISMLQKLDLDEVDYFLLLICIYDYLNEPFDHRVAITRLIYELTNEDDEKSFKIKKSILHGTHCLISNGIIQQAENDDFRDGQAVCLTPKVIELLEQDENIDKYEPKADKNLVEIKKEDVPRLFFNENIQKELDKIISVLQPERFKCIISEFKKSNMPTHCNILLTGAAGSGKTSMVYQICASINALVFRVQVAEMKSMYYGQTQKIISDTFAKFKKMAQANPNRTVVMFLDEADSLIGKRYENVSSSTSQTDNAVQSIILQALENFNDNCENCLMIATTNMVSSFCDDAILRRCLWKLDVGLPTPDISEKIWKYNLIGYSENLYKRLSILGLTGGYITNICRKVMMEKMIYQIDASEEMIYHWALAETSLKNSQMANVVGFQKAS